MKDLPAELVMRPATGGRLRALLDNHTESVAHLAVAALLLLVLPLLGLIFKLGRLGPGHWSIEEARRVSEQAQEALNRLGLE